MFGGMAGKTGADGMRKVMVIVFFFSMFGSFISVIIPIYLTGAGLSGYQIGALVSLYALTAVFVSFPTGVINDRWTIRMTMIIGILLFSSLFFGLGLFDGFLFFIPFFLAGGIGNNLGIISLRTLVYKTRAAGNEGRK